MADLSITEKLDHAAQVVESLFHAVSNLPVDPTGAQAKSDATTQIANIRAMIDDIRESMNKQP